MSNFLVFYGQQPYAEYEELHNSVRVALPDGCVIRYPSRNWYIKIGGGLTPINYSDIPPEVRLNCLLMGIPV